MSLIGYIQDQVGGYALCMNPDESSGVKSMSVKTNFTEEEKISFAKDIKKLAVSKHISAKFAQVILIAAKCIEEDYEN